MKHPELELSCSRSGKITYLSQRQFVRLAYDIKDIFELATDQRPTTKSKVASALRYADTCLATGHRFGALHLLRQVLKTCCADDWKEQRLRHAAEAEYAAKIIDSLRRELYPSNRVEPLTPKLKLFYTYILYLASEDYFFDDDVYPEELDRYFERKLGDLYLNLEALRNLVLLLAGIDIKDE